MKSEEAIFTDFNFSFTTFPRQTFVNFFDQKKAYDVIPVREPVKHTTGTVSS